MLDVSNACAHTNTFSFSLPLSLSLTHIRTHPCGSGAHFPMANYRRDLSTANRPRGNRYLRAAERKFPLTIPDKNERTLLCKGRWNQDIIIEGLRKERISFFKGYVAQTLILGREKENSREIALAKMSGHRYRLTAFLLTNFWEFEPGLFGIVLFFWYQMINKDLEGKRKSSFKGYFNEVNI